MIPLTPEEQAEHEEMMALSHKAHREDLARQVLLAIIPLRHIDTLAWNSGRDAEIAVEYADALIAQLEKVK